MQKPNTIIDKGLYNENDEMFDRDLHQDKKDIKGGIAGLPQDKDKSKYSDDTVKMPDDKK